MAIRGAAAFVAGLTLICASSEAGAQCTTRTDASAVQKSVRLATNCNYKKLRRGPATTCLTAPPPPCSGTLVDDAIKLAWGANNPPAAAVDTRLLRSQLTCQKLIGD